MRAKEQFKQAAISLGIKRWDVHECRICGYSCGYVFSTCYEFVMFDSGCDCTCRRVLYKREWEDIEKEYNMHLNSSKIEEYDDFWGLE